MTCVRDPLWWLLHGLQAHTSKKFSRIQNQNLYKDFWKFFIVEKKLHFPRCVGTNIDDFQWQAVKYLRHLPTRACRHVPTLPDFLIDDIMCICICTRSCICVFGGRHVPNMQDFLIDECLYLCATRVKVQMGQLKVTMHKHQRRRHQPAVKIAPKDKNCTDQWQAASAICAARQSQIQTDDPKFGWCRVKWLVNCLI